MTQNSSLLTSTGVNTAITDVRTVEHEATSKLIIQYLALGHEILSSRVDDSFRDVEKQYRLPRGFVAAIVNLASHYGDNYQLALQDFLVSGFTNVRQWIHRMAAALKRGEPKAYKYKSGQKKGNKPVELKNLENLTRTAVHQFTTTTDPEHRSKIQNSLEAVRTNINKIIPMGKFSARDKVFLRYSPCVVCGAPPTTEEGNALYRYPNGAQYPVCPTCEENQRAHQPDSERLIHLLYIWARSLEHELDIIPRV